MTAFFERLWFVIMLSCIYARIVTLDYSLEQLKTDPVCESARAALDTVNSQRERRK